MITEQMKTNQENASNIADENNTRLRTITFPPT